MYSLGCEAHEYGCIDFHPGGLAGVPAVYQERSREVHTGDIERWRCGSCRRQHPHLRRDRECTELPADNAVIRKGLEMTSKSWNVISLRDNGEQDRCAGVLVSDVESVQ